MAIDTIESPAALVLIDLQTGTLPNARSVPADELLDAAARLLAAFRESGSPVAHLISTGTPDGRTQYAAAGQVWPEEMTRIAPEVAPAGDEPVLSRRAWSGFAGSGLQEWLRERGVGTIVLAGLATTFGVESTARAGYDLGFHVIVASDAVSDPDPAGHERSLTRVFPVLGRVGTVAEIVALTHGSRT